MATLASVHAAIAAHRFGLGEASLESIGADPRGWLLAQIGPADAPRGERLATTREALEYRRGELMQRRGARQETGKPAERVGDSPYRPLIAADLRSRLATAITTRRPFAERLHWFWANHFTVSLAKGSVRGLVGAFEREAIRPHIAGSFEALLFAATTHPAMLLYLDNAQSAGPHSRIVARAARRGEQLQQSARVTGLNENLAREVLELHTLGAASGRGDARSAYTQADVTAFAALLTGWRVGPQTRSLSRPFDPLWHEPGAKTVLGRRYAEGPEALRELLRDLAQHPATAHFIATKLARHFVADDPPPALVDRLAARYRRSGGMLAEVYRELATGDDAWDPAPSKLKTPEEFVVSTARLLRFGERELVRRDALGMLSLGQRVHAAPSPAGWPDRADEWLGPDAVWKRVEWATRVGERAGRLVDARALADASLGERLGETSRRQVARAADGAQALALLLMAPEFQRR